jgi:hypothetical protein
MVTLVSFPVLSIMLESSPAPLIFASAFVPKNGAGVETPALSTLAPAAHLIFRALAELLGYPRRSLTSKV